MPHGPGSGGQLPPSFGGPFASLGSYMAAAAAAQAVRKPFDGPGSPLMASQGQGKMGKFYRQQRNELSNFIST